MSIGSTASCWSLNSLDFSTGHRREKAPSMLALVKDIICEECIPLVNSVRRNAAVWDGDIKVKEA